MFLSIIQLGKEKNHLMDNPKDESLNKLLSFFLGPLGLVLVYSSYIGWVYTIRVINPNFFQRHHNL